MPHDMSLPKQSPIDIQLCDTEPKDFPSDYLIIDYPDSDLSGHLGHEDIGEHKENFYFDSRPSAWLDGREATLERIHIHAPTSEHHLEGQAFPFEIHFVNPFKNPTADATHLLIGVFFRENDEAKTPQSIINLDKSLKQRIEKNLLDDQAPEVCINPREFLPTDLSEYFRYDGSLTTPHKGVAPPDVPNQEGKCWVVFRQVVEVRTADVTFLKAHCQDSARAIQPLNGREIWRSFE